MKRKFSGIFLIIFPLTALLFGVMTYFLLNFKSHGQHGVAMACGLGVMCGMVFGIGVGYFVRSLEYDFDIDPSIDISTRLQLMLSEMGYRVDNQFQKIITFKPTMRAGIFADRIRVEIIPGHVRIEGPHWHIEKICSNLGV
jgi:hypothetical protein